MRLLRGIGAVVVALCLVVMTAPGVASASTTEHGKWVTAQGTNNGQHGIDPGQHPLAVTGLWNINEGSQGLQVTGNLRILKQGQQCETQLSPCPFGLTLNMGTAWNWNAQLRAYTSTIGNAAAGGVQFDMALTKPDKQGKVILTMTITGCPYGWTSWVIQGETVS